MPLEELRGRDGLDDVLVEVHLAEQEVQEVRPLEPPVAEQLGVVGAHHERRPPHARRVALDLPLPVLQEVPAWGAAFSSARGRS